MLDKILTKEILGPIIIIIVSLLVYALCKAVIKKIFKFKVRGVDSKKQKTIMFLFINIVKVFVFVIASITILNIYRIDAKSILASLGVFTAVAALALQDVLKDFVNGISIILEGQFKVGDTINVDGFKGEVTYMSLKTTKIKAYTGEIKIIANHNITNVINYNLDNSLAIVDVAVAYDSNLEKVERILNSICEKLSNEIPELKDRLELLGVQELVDSAIIYRITGITESMKQFGVQRRVLKEIKVEFDKNKIEIPFKQVVVHNG